MPSSKKTKPVCFFVTPIGSDESPERKRADQVQRYILKAVLGSKFEIIRADQFSHPGSITQQIIDLVYRADLVVADLTGSNANVAYELALRHSFNKISIHLADKADRIPFDLKDERTIVFDLHDPDSVNNCKNEIRKIVEAIDSGSVTYHSPVFRALSIAAAAPDERENFLNQIIEQIDTIATDVSSIENTLTFSDIDDLSDIKDTVGEIEKNQAELERMISDLKDDVQKILDSTD
jgi:methyl-accepting chemotaxis protein